MNEPQHIKYVITSQRDLDWGIIVKTVGNQTIGAGETYPPRSDEGGHPSRYLFRPETGRILDEYQLIYLAEGSGEFSSASTGRRKIRVGKGDAFLLFPGEWHSYHPDADSGWKEYWIGFDGDIPDGWLAKGHIEKEKPVFHAGVEPGGIAAMYERGFSLAIEQGAGYQQVLGSIAVMLVSAVIFNDRNSLYRHSGTENLAARARSVISEDIAGITPEKLAERLGLNYSKFRRIFKGYTNITPGQYILEMKVARAKELLTNTSHQIQEISWEVGFDNPDYFVTMFKRVTGVKPSEYRRVTTMSS